MDILNKLNLFLNEGIFDPSIFKAIFLAGGPGSGKGYVVKKATSGHGFRIVNSDELFEKMLKDAGISMDMIDSTEEEEKERNLIRTKAKEKTSKKMNLLLKGHMGFGLHQPCIG